VRVFGRRREEKRESGKIEEVGKRKKARQSPTTAMLLNVDFASAFSSFVLPRFEN